MAFTFEEFPNSDYYNSDLRQVLAYMRKFEKTLDEWEALALELQEKLQILDSFDGRIKTLEADNLVIHDSINGILDDISSIRANITTIETDIKALQKEDLYLQGEIDEINRKYSALATDVQSLHNDIRTLYNYVDAKCKSVESKLISLMDEKVATITLEFKEIQREIAELKKRVDAIDTFVVNPWHWDMGKISLTTNNKLIYNDLADECLTAEEYGTLNLSAEDYAKFDLYARDYHEFGKKKLHFRWVYAPIEGWRQEISNVLTSIINNIKGTLTASQYASLDLDADAYTLLDLTSEDYYSYNPLRTSGYVMYDENATGLTSDEYSHLKVVTTGG